MPLHSATPLIATVTSSNNHSDMIQQLNTILSSINKVQANNKQYESESIKQTVAQLVNDIQKSFKDFNILNSGTTTPSTAMNTTNVINTQIAMEKFTVTVTALSKLIGTVEKSVSTLMHGQ